MLDATDKQFKLMDDGKIFFQPDPSNPLPGEELARILKGEAPLRPRAEITAQTIPGGTDKEPAAARVEKWLEAHIAQVLQPLVALGGDAGEKTQPAPVEGICAQIHEAMGIVPRENLEGLIAGLDPAMRQELRARKIRLGPVLVFLPDLNKPAAVRLRALLWTLWQEKNLPACVPYDGSVSVRVEEGGADAAFYQAIGYPLYGPRAVRIDMLDRVISAVYDSAKDGKFQARHEMAEWLGCPIDDLYAVLEAMGHRKLEEQPAPELQPEQTLSTPAPVEVKAEQPKPAQGDLFSAPAEEKPAVASEVSKPEGAPKPQLAFFRLKKGKANQTQERAPKKPFRERQAGKPGQNRDSQQRDKKQDKKRFQKPQRPPRDERPRVIEARPKGPAPDSPFAVLEQLKAKRDA